MIAVDNSEWTRNGDYAPTRFSAQNEAVGYLANAKLQENQESSVGLMSMAGNRIEVLISPGREPGQLLNALSRVPISGESNVIGALKTAQLALKNRQNKNQRQRIILFVGSPLTGTDAGELVKLGKLLKKNNVAVDVINFGTENTVNDNTEKLEQLVAAVNTADNSHMVSIPPGPHIFADLVLTSAIMQSGGGGSGIAGVPSAGGAAGGMGGVDADMDPEMAMAIRMSMEEERQRQQKASGADAGAAGGAAGSPAAGAAAAAPMEEDEDALLAQAIALSMQENQDAPMDDAAAAASSQPAASSTAAGAAAASPPAAAASPAASGSASSSAAAAPVASAADIDLAMQDPDFLNSLLAGVPGAAGGQSVDNLLDELTGAQGGAAGSSTEKKDEKKDADKK